MQQHFLQFSLFTPIFLLISLLHPPTISAINITSILSNFSDLSGFNRLLTTTSVARELAGRSSVTLLAVPDRYLYQSETAARSASVDIADVLRYHILLQYLSPTDLHTIPASGKLITTLYQTTGRATANFGSLNLTSTDGKLMLKSPAPFSPSNTTILSLITTVPYNISIFTVDSLLLPYGFDLTASGYVHPPVSAMNITRILIEARGFNVAASMLEASGVATELQGDERGAGITAFVPTDEAFAGLPATERLQSLPAERKAAVLRFHVLHSYYPLGSLESIVNPVQPTLATEDTEAGRFTLNITRVNGSVAIDTGVVQACITRTVFDQNPVSIFAVSKVLLPREMFGKARGEGVVAAVAPTAGNGAGAVGLPPQVAETPPTRISSPPGMKGEIVSIAGTKTSGNGWMIWCIGILLSLLV
ncbi:hypothetical protein LUZ63_017916 [Rhynchospora breviuscula]|uniref:FAS1 domain-containing protein n=1 Tax=Rhynchospora breviuscula TaxID=2022672 RepID=A0A9Q0C3C4_9POAL|nr:hypothetical protein LUZ63_017916 [Rhynchospora breviuscula]